MKKLFESKRNRVICAAVAAGLALAATIGFTLAAYLNQSEQIVNHFSVGNVTTDLVESFYEKEGSGGHEFVKTPQVVNTGANDCYVRVRISVTPESVASKKVVDAEGNLTDTDYLVIDTESGAAMGWSYNEADGWWYYGKPVKPGETTPALFTTVKVNYDEDKNPWIDFDIILYHEAVQTRITADDGKTLEGMDEIWDYYEEKRIDQ